jgi:hypothetical protein
MKAGLIKRRIIGENVGRASLSRDHFGRPKVEIEHLQKKILPATLKGFTFTELRELGKFLTELSATPKGGK